jgi:CRISPR-associated protein Cas1
MKRNIFIFSGGELKREENTICFISEGSKRFVPVSNISSIYVFGELSFNKRLLEFLSTNEITLHFFNYYGYYIGSFYPRTHYNSGFMTLKQCEHYLDKDKRVNLARKFVEGALRNMYRNILYYENRKGGMQDTIDLIELLLKNINYVSAIEELMALEGKAKEEYYLSFNKIIEDERFVYEKRERRPPKDRLNALLSFGNSLIYVTVLGEIYKTHLDPRIGFLHTSNYRKFSLNLDVAEIFKPIIADRIIFTLINKRMLDHSCFIEELNGTYLSNKGKDIFIKQYDAKLRQVISFNKRQKCSYLRLIRIELYKLEKHLIGEKQYEPFVSQW